ncbi:MAG TPA: hypothetical protein VKU19_08505 [Bryobacteraceae bacterium]|nr:hypothetical protein [Bryobacteraceae bacterium]
MNRIHFVAITSLSLLTLTAGLSSVRAQGAAIVTPIVVSPNIVVIEIEEADTAKSSEIIDARIRVTEVLKDGHHLGLRPGTVDATIRTAPSPAQSPDTSAWTGRHIQAGRKYLLLSARKNLREIIELPESAEELTDEIDAIGDVELILRSYQRPLNDQSRGLAEVLSGTSQHSVFLARYISELLAAGSDSDTALLAQTLEGAGGMALAESAKPTLLVDLSARYGLYRSARNLRRVFANLILRYFTLGPDGPDGRPSLVQYQILHNCLPQIRRYDENLAVLAEAGLPEDAIKRVRAKALQLAANTHVRVVQRTEARALAEQFAPK